MKALSVTLMLLLGLFCVSIAQDTTSIRVAHLSPDAPNVDIWLDGEIALSDMPFQAISDYLTIPAGEHRIQISPAGATQPIVIDTTVTFEANESYTVAATGLLGTGDLEPIVLLDDSTTDLTQAKIRFVHTSPDAPAVDVAVAGGPTLFSNSEFRNGSDYISVDAGSYDLEVRLAGASTVALSVPGLELRAGTNYSIFAIGLAGDGSLATLPAIDAEFNEVQVRVAHLSADAPNVDVWVDGSIALSDVPFGAVSDYLTLSAGERRIQISPAGATEPIVIDATVTIEAGKAYTIAATGLLDANELSAVVFLDDLAQYDFQARVRFLHTSPDAPAVDVAVAGGPILFSNYSFRESSAYANVDPGTYDLEVRLAGTNTVVLSIPGVVLSPGTNYSIFAIGSVNDGTLAALAIIDASGEIRMTRKSGSYEAQDSYYGLPTIIAALVLTGAIAFLVMRRL